MEAARGEEVRRAVERGGEGRREEAEPRGALRDEARAGGPEVSAQLDFLVLVLVLVLVLAGSRSAPSTLAVACCRCLLPLLPALCCSFALSLLARTPSLTARVCDYSCTVRTAPCTDNGPLINCLLLLSHARRHTSTHKRPGITL